MIGKVKHWLGIEGIKLDIQLPAGQPFDAGQLQGSAIYARGKP
ncbi:MAG: hypothetical protein R2795_06215 [Saprospiraceae bacterium]